MLLVRKVSVLIAGCEDTARLVKNGGARDEGSRRATA
jgi:hypothetical protein